MFTYCTVSCGRTVFVVCVGIGTMQTTEQDDKFEFTLNFS